MSACALGSWIVDYCELRRAIHGQSVALLVYVVHRLGAPTAVQENRSFALINVDKENSHHGEEMKNQTKID